MKNKTEINNLPIHLIKDYERVFLFDNYSDYGDKLYVENDKHDVIHVIHRMLKRVINGREFYVYCEKEENGKVLNVKQVAYIKSMADYLDLEYTYFKAKGIHAVCNLNTILNTKQ